MTTRRGVGFVFALIGLAILVSAAGMVVLYVGMSGSAGLARSARVTSSSTLVLRPDGDLPEVRPDDVFDQFVDRPADNLRGFLAALRRAKTDPRITSVVLMPGSLDSPYWAKVQELRDAIVDFRRSKKPVTAYLEYGGDREYYLASAADKIYLPPSSALDLTGIASYEIFLRGTFDKLGAYPDFIHIGDYKTATNQLTERRMTPAHREMSESLNRDTFDQLVRAIAEGRHKSEDQVRALIDDGPFLPKAALDAGLVDGVAYEDELDDLVPALKRRGRSNDWVEADEYGVNGGDGVRLRRRPRIAVLYAVGTIVSGRSGFDPTDGDLIGSDTIIEDIRRIRDDRSIRGIVLRIDSPGGSSVASDVILRELQLTKKDNPDRPIVVSMSDLAASGGYYIALAGDEIVAQPGTLTGSIGIYSGKIVYGGTLEKVGVTTEKVTSGANADIYSPLTPFNPAQREKVESFMRDFYTGFLDKTAESRHMTREEVHALAQGRVWTGAQAKENGLVDRLGGLDEAIAALKERADIDPDTAVETVVYPRRRTFYEALSDQFGRSDGGASLVRALTGVHGPARAIAAATAPGRLFRRGEPLAIMPFAFVR